MSTQQGTESVISDQTAQKSGHLSRLRRRWPMQNPTYIIQNSIPVRYDRRVRVVPCSPDRVPRLPVDILYLIAQALPRPKWVYNLARVNKQSWYYLQPALYKCEVTYEARLKEHFGVGDEHITETWPIETQTGDEGEIQDPCQHGKKTRLCEECGDQIAIEKAAFNKGDLRGSLLEQATKSNLTALHWACAHWADRVTIGLKAIRAASVHQPSYIDGTGLILRVMGHERVPYPGQPRRRGFSRPFSREIPPPLFVSVASGNNKLCKALIEAGCNVNLIQPAGWDRPAWMEVPMRSFRSIILCKIHDKCGPFPGIARPSPSCWWEETQVGDCQTVGHVAVNLRRPPFVLELLLDSGLDPLLGTQSLLQVVVLIGNVSATKLLLDRYPKLGRRRWRDSRTPLHGLCDTSRTLQFESNPLLVLLTIGRYLVESGADLEAGSNHPPRLVGTPLQHALENGKYDSLEGSGLLAAEAFIMLGSIWNQPLSPFAPNNFILDHCISGATSLYGSFGAGWTFFNEWEGRGLERQLRYTLLVRTIVQTSSVSQPPEAGRMQSMVFLREAFSDAFNKLATQSIPLPTRYDAFATEVVGKLLLSTGITPEASVISEWTQSMRKIQGWTARTLSGRKRSLWHDIMSGRSISQKEIKAVRGWDLSS